MEATISEQKRAMRLQVRTALSSISPEDRLLQSTLACALLRGQAAWANARSVLFYAPMPGELDVWPLFQEALAAGKTVALPRYSPVLESYTACAVRDPLAEVRTGSFGIREPVESCGEFPLNRLDLVLVPGVAFDLHGHRLGRGKGYYDRLLSGVVGRKCGVAFDEQVVSEVPVEAHDAILTCILTPTRWFDF